MKQTPRLTFAHLPTPIEALPRLSAALGGPELYVKRDDQTGLAFGGNKTRKLEFLLAEAQANDARTLITAGALQSNHCRQTAAAAARFGFKCILVVYPASPPDDALAALPSPSANLLLDQLLGAEIVLTTRAKRDQTLHETFEKARDARQSPYQIPYGGSNTTGAASYVVAMQELISQNQLFDWILFPSSSGGTQAGLTLGARLFGFQGNVLGVSVDESQGVLKERVATLASQTAEYIGEKESFKPGDIQVNADYLGGGYGVMGFPEREAIELFARYEGLLLDPVYTGRAAAGLIDLIRANFFPRDAKVLFWHTGGSPALFADAYRTKLF